MHSGGTRFMKALDGLDPQALWRHFGEISRIPRESGNEAAIAGHVRTLASGLGLACTTDDAGNVIVKKIRRGELTLAEGETIRGELKQLPLQQHADARLFPAAYQFAVDTQRSLYDCLYLALAAAIDGILVTADRKFYAAVAKGVYGRRVLWVEDLPPTA